MATKKVVKVKLGFTLLYLLRESTMSATHTAIPVIRRIEPVSGLLALWVNRR
jgi:hypothetical protein